MPQRIGDFVLALSVVARKAEQADESLTLIVPQHLIPLCILLSPLSYFPFRRSNRAELLQSITGVKHQGFDKLYLLTHSLSLSWFSLRSGVPVRRGVSSELLSPFLTQVVHTSADRNAEHVTREYAEVLEVPYHEPSQWVGRPVTPTNDFNNHIALCPGSGYGLTAQWQGYKEVVKLLPSYDFVILGSADDGVMAKTIAPHLPHRVKNMAGKTTIEAAASILSTVAVIIANHSGLLQIGGFLGTPTVGIFGATSAVRSRPLGKQVRTITAENACVACYKTSCAKKDYRCLSSITPETVIEKAGEIVRHIK